MVVKIRKTADTVNKQKVKASYVCFIAKLFRWISLFPRKGGMSCIG